MIGGHRSYTEKENLRNLWRGISDIIQETGEDELDWMRKIYNKYNLLDYKLDGYKFILYLDYKKLKELDDYDFNTFYPYCRPLTMSGFLLTNKIQLKDRQSLNKDNCNSNWLLIYKGENK